MKPSVSELLGGGAMTIATGVLPLLEANPYGKGHATIAMMLMMLAAQEAEKAADVLHRENRALRDLFARAIAAPLGVDLVAALNDAMATHDASLRVSVLQAENARLRSALVRLHAAVDDVDDDWAIALDREIWALLLEGARARLVDLPPL